MRRAPGGGLLHPLALVSIAVLVLNDHVLKQHWSGWLTGKLSDFAGLVFFPLLLQALWELLSQRTISDRRVLVTACLLTVVSFTLVKTWPPATQGWSAALGLLQWPFLRLLEAARGGAAPGFRPVYAVTDPTDLIALPAVGLALWIGWRRAGEAAVS